MDEISKVKVLVTGGRGMLGRAIVSLLLKEHYRVRVLTRVLPLKNESLPCEYFQGDILNKAQMEEAVLGCSAVFHCAAEIKDEPKMQEVNVVGTKHVFEAARKNGVGYFCHLSSVGVIGRTNKKIVDETICCHPMNCYEKTKLEAEKKVETGLDQGTVVILRPTNVFDRSTLIQFVNPNFLNLFRFWLKAREKGHLVYVEDVAAAAFYFLKNKIASPACKIFIVSSDEEEGNVIGEIVSKINSFYGKKNFNPIWSPPIEISWILRVLRHGVGNKGDICYSSKKLFSTGFIMPFGLQEGLKKAMNETKEKISPL